MAADDSFGLHRVCRQTEQRIGGAFPTQETRSETSLKINLAKCRGGERCIVRIAVLLVSLAFFNEILQVLMQDAAFSFANRCKCVL